jgi:site-specific DNA-cytosine methylase
VTQPADKGLVIRDIYVPDKSLEREDSRIAQTAIKTKNYIKYDISNKGYYSQAHRLYYMDGKAPTQARCRTETKTNILLDEDTYRYKIISPIECERLQTLPDNYTAGLPKTRRFEVLGNGWTVDVIAHILRGIKCTNQKES